MRLYPAIDIIGGQCVRLSQGDYQKKTTFSEDPLAVAKKWESLGGEFLHLVDLDGAKTGDMPNFDLIVSIAKELKIPVEIGGGIRNMDAVSQYLENGVQRVILGTAAIRNPEFVKEAVSKYNERIVIGIDAKDGMVAVSGWEEVSAVSALELAKQMEEIGVKTIIYTDIATDGMLKGPNVLAMKEMAEHVSMDVVASGGVSSLADLELLFKTGVEGAIVGKALYTGHMELSDAVVLCRSFK
ncbi:MAG: 1-(5-phosphoribosyl)-5-[(5-phosphoribosylamino)methylideneamino]imidazole-4-carboxamide isomerase [Clostridia bacterium]|nr:1-(5-phosphoribosyl)-5-[(5-phosphoribosylamino)methylideneamino]imidazole-4-carboxamide isomerase [Clostridia bacterium]